MISPEDPSREMSFGLRLRIVRTARLLKLAELAQLSGVGLIHINLIESGKMNATEDMKRRLRATLRWDERADDALALLEATEELVSAS